MLELEVGNKKIMTIMDDNQTIVHDSFIADDVAIDIEGNPVNFTIEQVKNLND